MHAAIGQLSLLPMGYVNTLITVYMSQIAFVERVYCSWFNNNNTVFIQDTHITEVFFSEVL